MADFLLSEAVDNDLKTTIDCEGNIINIDNDNKGNNVNMTLSDEEFIDDSFVEESVSDYYEFTNVSREYDDAIQDSFSDFDYDQEANNYCDKSEIYDSKIDDFKDHKSKIEKFEKTLVGNPQVFEKKRFFFLFYLVCNKIPINK